MKRRKLLKKIRRLHHSVRNGGPGWCFLCAECGAPHPCETYRIADGFTKW